MATKKITKEMARAKVRRWGISLNADYHTLNASDVGALLYLAKDMGYRKPKGASGSTGRYFFAYLKSNRGG